MSIKSILIIDDSEVDQYLAKYMIEQFNSDIEIIHAYDGQEALEILADLPSQPDIILLDINMPRMNGLEFLNEYDKWQTKNSVVVMLTSSDRPVDREQSLAHECVRQYFTKPIDKSDLECLVR
ncbi:response regulator [Aliiglaciecola sp. LCG003]|uniref:response regulator n=1 Tax=Aliiglaciecola sp. LCG003 TaxID=3053655 RepID=UPI0025728257|nr:response regulator [Aliiglaciecola sp. LCG003]WJG10288.1 response regulator [Aliiglaciecola sp. LCG003]